MKTFAKVLLAAGIVTGGVFAAKAVANKGKKPDDIPELEDLPPAPVAPAAVPKLPAAKPAAVLDPFKEKVKQLQKALNLTSDGVIGPKTKAAVSAFGFKDINALNIDQILTAAAKKKFADLPAAKKLSVSVKSMAELLYRHKDDKVKVVTKSGAVELVPDYAGKAAWLRGTVKKVVEAGGSGKDLTIAYYDLYKRNLKEDYTKGINLFSADGKALYDAAKSLAGAESYQSSSIII